MSVLPREAAELLHSLGYIYGQHGQERRGLALMLIAARIAPDDPGVLKTLAAAFIATGAGDRALAVIDRVAEIEGGLSSPLALLRSRALWAGGRKIEARQAFRDYVVDRNAEPEPRADVETREKEPT
ncbi:type III secretion protein [Chenggangzhangella methanolivorans]|uniref:Type III secretion protein n=1 Tax=Chenggangzhangella methanolivorans TaxID=1437009 RepID=A0A9E6ULS1_9HYPH|nr:type III secretion protein [Chenggangzhangella methanolivorans]QZN98473.1 type III secretion protein [Chenggangzhangella methanolivorans]